MNTKEKDKGYLGSIKKFGSDSINLLKKCQKPNRKEYFDIMKNCAIGFAVIGAVGFLIKLLFIPINNIILSGGGA